MSKGVRFTEAEIAGILSNRSKGLSDAKARHAVATSKYHNTKIELDGLIFDSKKEAKVYCDLQRMKQAGEIKDFTRQQSFELIPAQYETINGKKKCVEKSVKYVADFVVAHNNGDTEVLDAKGMRTPIYIIKRKLMRYINNIGVKEI